MTSANDKSHDWLEEDVIDVLKSLKNNKCRDPLGLINEIFKPPVAGNDLIKSLTILMNSVKNQLKVPNLFRMKNISTIYKNKGSRSNLENDRGIFICTVFNTILQKLIYEDNYELIDSNLSDSNVGARKHKNIRNHSFIINGIINDTVVTKKKAVDLAILDYRQCFDALSVDLTLNDLYEVGVINDHLNLINECDSSSLVAIKTPAGITKRVRVEKIVSQGEVPAPLKCTVTVDSISKSHMQDIKGHHYIYKNLVTVPPLGMVDDQVGISECGLDSVISTASLNAQTNIKKLQFGESKCHKIHIGNKEILCPKNKIDTWTSEKSSDNITSVFELIDAEGEKHIISSLKNDGYLGDIIQSNGKMDLNIKERTNRGQGAIQQISQLLENMCLGRYHFETANVLRDSLLLSSLISNSESWYNLTSRDISNLEKIDENLLRKILSAHSKTPKEMLYLETGNIPIRFILKGRRLNFLWYILNEDEDSLLYSFFKAQCENPVRGDWVNTVKSDLDEIDIKMDFESIKIPQNKHLKN